MQPPNPANAGNLVGRRLGKYDVLALLALGGTAEIYLARIGGEAGFEKYVVVKCLHDHLAEDKEFVHMFLDEARLGAQLDHSNIVQTLELGEDSNRYYLVMEFLAGMSLAQIARKARQRVPGGRIPVDLALGIAAQACAGLHYAHCRTASDGSALNIVHRDVSPQNLVITFEGMVKLVDFGIAKAEQRETSTKSGTIKGKFAYMSPEQCLAQHVDRRTDIFALGTVVHELLTGRRLFKRGSTYETYQAIVAGHVQPPSQLNHELDPALDPVVMKALAYNRDERYPTAEAFGEALLHLLHRRGKSVSPSDVSRFFDQYFGQEIEEHAARMRGLIEGRETSTMDEMVWDLPDGQSDAAARMPDDDPQPLGGGDDELEGESTRIELNPLERVQAMHEQVSGQSVAEEATAHLDRPRPRRTVQAPAVAPPAQRAPTTSLRPAAPSVPAGTLKPPVGSKTIAPGGLPPMSLPRSGGPSGPAPRAPAPSAPAAPARPAAPAPSAPAAQARPAAAGAPPAAGKRKPAGRGAPPAAAPAPSPARGPDGDPLPPPPMADAAANQKTMLAGEAPSLEDIQRAAAEADRILGSQGQAPPPAAPPPAAPAPAPVDQKTMLAGEAPSLADIQRAAAEADRILGNQGQQQAPPPAAPSAPQQVAGKPGGPAEAFPPIHTPTAFRQRADLIGSPDPTATPSGDLAVLASERATRSGDGTSPLVLALAFVVSCGVGLGLTVLIATLAG